MKLKHLLLTALMTVVGIGSSWAQEFANGEYLLRNVETGGYLQGDSYWGTKAVVKDIQYLVTLTLSNGKYTIKTQQNNGGQNQYVTAGADPYVDGASCEMTFTKDGDYYTINNGTGNLYAVAQTEDNATFYKVMAGDNTTNAAKWEVISKTSLTEALNNASTSNPVDATFLIKDAGFDMKSVNKSAWTGAGDPGGGNAGHGLESWNTNSFDIYQTVSGLPNGKYKVSCRGFYRYNNTNNNDNAAAIAAHSAGTEQLRASLYAGLKSVPLMSVANYEGSSETLPHDAASCTALWKACANFTAGYFLNELTDVVVTDGTLRIGVKKTQKDGTDWTVFDDFRIEYYGEDISDYEAAYNAACEAANAVDQTKPMHKDVKSALETAISTYVGKTYTKVADITAAISALQTATTNATSSIAQYATNATALAAQKAIIDGTNVYATGWTTGYVATYNEKQNAYDNRTLNEVVVNPNDATGWHASTAYNDLLTPWTIGGEACNNFDKALYINTWSTEGSTDGSNFTTPFFEFWVADGESLPNKVLATNVTGLENGLYSATAWVRVRAKNGVAATEATGINLVAGDGTYAGSEGNGTVDATEGAQVGSSQFTLAEVTAYGLVKDGNLNISFDVKDANISWLSYKNVKYTKVRDLTPEEAAVVPTAITLDKTEVTLTAAENTVTLTPSFTPNDATETVTWETSDANVATVANGVVTGVAPGTATITVKSTLDENVKATCVVTVSYAETVYETNLEAVDATNKAAINITTLSADNIIKNGSFEYANGVANWNMANGSEMTTTHFDVVADNETHYIKSKTHAGSTGAGSIRTVWAIENGKTYVFSYKVKASATGKSQYHVLSLTNTVGTETTKVSVDDTPVTTDWTTVTYQFTNTNNLKYAQFNARWLGDKGAYTCFDDFYLAEVTETSQIGNVAYAVSQIPTANIGTGAFQLSQAAIDATNALVQGTATVQDVENAVVAMETLKAPAENDVYSIVMAKAGLGWTGKAATFTDGNVGQGNYAIAYSATPGATHYNQSIHFVSTGEVNKYNAYICNDEGTKIYITDGTHAGSTVGWAKDQIRMTETAADAMPISVKASATVEGQYEMFNAWTGVHVGSTNNNGFYCSNDNYDLNIVPAVKTSASLKVTDAKWATFIAPFDADIPEDVEVYSPTVSGNVITLGEAVGSIKANTPYIVYSASVVNEELFGWGLATKDEYSVNALCGTLVEKNLIPADGGDNYYVLQNHDGKVAFYACTESETYPINSNRCFFQIPSSNESAPRVLIFSGDATGVNAVEANTEVLDAVEVYSVNGAKQNGLMKGINIVKMSDGSVKKIMVK